MKLRKIISIVLIFLGLVCCSCFFPSFAEAATYYISPTGSDSNSGSITSPWATYGHATSRMQPGDTLYARGGTYNVPGGYVWNAPATTLSNPITFAAYPGETPVFDGQWSRGEFLVLTTGDEGVIIRGLTITHYNDEYGNGAITILGSARNIILENLIMVDNGTNSNMDHHIYLGASNVQNVTIRNNLLLRAAAGGIHGFHATNARNVHIYNNIIRDCGNWGIILTDDGRDIDIYNNTLINNGGGGNIVLARWGSARVYNVTLRNNISYSSSSVGLWVGSNSLSEVHADYNLWYDTSGDPIYWGGSSYSISEFQANTSNADHSIQANPQFVSLGGADFHLESSSPAIDSGTGQGAPSYDFDGDVRPQGSGYDVGAYEYPGSTAPIPTPTSGVSPTPTPDCQYAQDTSVSHTGNNSARTTSTDPNTDCIWVSGSNVATPYNNYRLSSWIRTRNVVGEAYARVVFLDSNGNQILTSRTTGVTGSTSNSAENDFVLQETTTQAPSRTSQVRLELVLSGAGSAWFDDVGVFDLGPPVTPTLTTTPPITQTPLPSSQGLQYYGVDNALPSEFAWLSQQGVNLVMMSLSGSGGGQEYYTQARNYGIKLLIWPLGGGVESTPWTCPGIEEDYNRGCQDGNWNIDAGRPLLDELVANSDVVLAVQSLHEAYHSGTPHGVIPSESQKILADMIRDYTRSRGHEIEVYNYINLIAGAPDPVVEGQQDWAAIWRHSMCGHDESNYDPNQWCAEGTKNNTLQRIRDDSNYIQSRGWDMKVLFSIQTFGMSGYVYTMPTEYEIYRFACDVLAENRLDAFVYYSWRNPAGYSDVLYNHPELHGVIRRVYDDCVQGLGSLPSPSLYPTASLTSTPTIAFQPYPSVTPTLYPTSFASPTPTDGSGGTGGISTALYTPRIISLAYQNCEIVDEQGTVTLNDFECIFQNIVTAVFHIAGIVSFVMLIIGGYKYLTSGGNQKALESAKKTITYALGGLVLLAVTYLVLVFIATLVGNTALLNFEI